MIKINSKKAEVLAVLAVIVIVIAILFVGYLTFRGKEKVEGIQELEIKELKFCSYIINLEEGYNCIKQGDANYRGDTIWIYGKIFGLKSVKENGRYKVGFIQYLEVTDPDGLVIPELNKKMLDREEITDGKEAYVPFKNKFDVLPTDKTGRYTVKITVRDGFSDKEVIKIINYDIEE